MRFISSGRVKHPNNHITDLEEVCRVAKAVKSIVKLQIPAGKANPAPPVGPALGQHGVNIMGFCKEFNAKTANQAGLIIPVVITVYQDRSFSFILKTPPGVPNRTKVGSLTKDQVRKIAELKMPDLNAATIETAMSMIEGTARSMGVTIAE